MTPFLPGRPPHRGRIRSYILLLAGEGGRAVRSIEALQMMLYTVARKTGDGEVEAGFGPGERGPHSKDAADELDRMSGDGLVSRAQGAIATTPVGRAAARDARRGLGEYTRAAIAGYGPFFNAMTDEQLLLYTRLLHPDMTANSRECIGLARRADEIVMGMVRDEKISSGRAAEVLGIPIRDILPMMKKHGIPNLY